jgi:hypothetical protein
VYIHPDSGLPPGAKPPGVVVFGGLRLKQCM